MNLGTESRAIRTVLIVLGAVVLLFAAYYAYWQHQFQRARTAAGDFCESAAIGSDVADAVARLKTQDRVRVRDGFQENESRYVAIFYGPIFNAFICEIELANRKVVSKRVKELED
jgi:hypothetical protein